MADGSLMRNGDMKMEGTKTEAKSIYGGIPKGHHLMADGTVMKDSVDESMMNIDGGIPPGHHLMADGSVMKDRAEQKDKTVCNPAGATPISCLDGNLHLV